MTLGFNVFTRMNDFNDHERRILLNKFKIFLRNVLSLSYDFNFIFGHRLQHKGEKSWKV